MNKKIEENGLAYDMTRRKFYEKPLPESRVKFLIGELKKEYNASYETELVEHNLRSVALIASKFKNVIEYEDAFCYGLIGLAKAIRNFDCNKGYRFSTFSFECITNEILMAYRVEARNIKNKGEFIKKFERFKFTDEYFNDLDIENLGLDVESHYIEKEEKEINSKKIRRAFNSSLTSEQKNQISLYYGLGNNCKHQQKELADMYGASQSMISRKIKKAKKELFNELVNEGVFEPDEEFVK